MFKKITDVNYGMDWIVRIVQHNDNYGRDMCLTHDKTDKADILIEFYDTRYPLAKDPSGIVLGQFVSRYYWGTLESLEGYGGNGGQLGTTGINLYGGVADWTVSAEMLREARTWIVDQIGGE